MIDSMRAGETTGVKQQLAHGRPRCVTAELRQQITGAVSERELATLDQIEHGCRGERLADRADAVDRVNCGSSACRTVRDPVPGDTIDTLARHHRDRAIKTDIGPSLQRSIDANRTPRVRALRTRPGTPRVASAAPDDGDGAHRQRPKRQHESRHA